MLISNFRTGELYKLPPGGGAANTGNIVSTPGQTIGNPVFGKDGKLYATRGATGGGFFSGNILELDPQTGATVRVVASNLTCPAGLAVDPISGDLFFTGQCFGAGADDARLAARQQPRQRHADGIDLRNVAGNAERGRFVRAGRDDLRRNRIHAGDEAECCASAVRISRSRRRSRRLPGGLETNFWVTVGETLPNGAAKSLIVLGADKKLKLADITTNPPTLTDLTTTAASSGIIGPDGCLYAPTAKSSSA